MPVLGNMHMNRVTWTVASGPVPFHSTVTFPETGSNLYCWLVKCWLHWVLSVYTLESLRTDKMQNTYTCKYPAALLYYLTTSDIGLSSNTRTIWLGQYASTVIVNCHSVLLLITLCPNHTPSKLSIGWEPACFYMHTWIYYNNRFRKSL